MTPDDDNDPDDHYSQSTDDEKKKIKKRSKRKNPTSAIRSPRNAHWEDLKTPEEGEAANVLFAIGVEHNIAKFMEMDGLDCFTEIQELSKVTIALYARNIKRHLHRSNFMITRFILDLERDAFKMTQLTHQVSHTIIIADTNRTCCRSMNDQMALK